eukprot:2465371-Ditylum_brightwellii.AAC.1
MNKCNKYGEPILPPKNTTILCSIWTYVVKHDGRKKACNCCNGSVLKKKGNDYANTYSTYANQVGIRLFTSIVAIKNLLILGADETNAYAQSPPPSTPTFMRIDDQYDDWYKNKYDKELDRKHVLPVLHALQGHPESGALWGKYVEKSSPN